ncbi:hypothetical protein HPB50_027856 [Hyalomma asiaticum]|nr:hypothetical protein HPB50_027856 [Hyalomma asiaticum]
MVASGCDGGRYLNASKATVIPRIFSFEKANFVRRRSHVGTRAVEGQPHLDCFRANFSALGQRQKSSHKDWHVCSITEAVDMGVPSCSRRKRLIDGNTPAFSEGSPALKTPSSLSHSASRDETDDDVSQNKAIMYVLFDYQDTVVEPVNEPDGRCSCLGRRKRLLRLVDCDLVSDIALKTTVCHYNTRHLARPTPENRHQSTGMWRGTGRSRLRR